MLDGSYPCTKVHFGWVTVKDTARAHVEAMIHPDANGKDSYLQKNVCGYLMNGF